MSISKTYFSIFLVFVMSVLTTATAANMQCVSIVVPTFIIVPDSSCSISESALSQSKAPDQELLYNLGATAEESCFLLFNPLTGETSVDGEINNLETGEQLLIQVTGIVGLTFNNYPASPLPNAESYTATSVFKLKSGETKLGSLVTRDSGTVFENFYISARQSVVKGTKKLAKAKGYIDEFGYEFNPADPASASGILCGNNLANKLF